MKITKKILQDIIKEEIAKALNRKPITESWRRLIPHLKTAAKAVGAGVAGEAVYSRLASVLGLDQDQSDEFAKYLFQRDHELYMGITKETSRLLKKANEKIADQNIRIKALEEVVENIEFNKSVDTERSIASK